MGLGYSADDTTTRILRRVDVFPKLKENVRKASKTFHESKVRVTGLAISRP